MYIKPEGYDVHLHNKIKEDVTKLQTCRWTPQVTSGPCSYDFLSRFVHTPTFTWDWKTLDFFKSAIAFARWNKPERCGWELQRFLVLCLTERQRILTYPNRNIYKFKTSIGICVNMWGELSPNNVIAKLELKAYKPTLKTNLEDHI